MQLARIVTAECGGDSPDGLYMECYAANVIVVIVLRSGHLIDDLSREPCECELINFDPC